MSDEEMEVHNDSDESVDIFFEESDTATAKSAVGAEFKEFHKVTNPQIDTNRTKVFVFFKDWSRPFPSRLTDIWDYDHVRLPWSSHNEFPKDGKVMPRWRLVVQALTNPQILRSKDLIKTILDYNRADRWNFEDLRRYLDDYLEDIEKSHFYADILPPLCRLALQLPELVTQPMPLLKIHKNQSIGLSQNQIASLLANAFFCTYPKRNSQGKRSEYANYPTINFNALFNQSNEDRKCEKLNCLMNYFRKRLNGRCGNSLVTFTRRSFSEAELPNWKKSEKTLRKLRIDAQGCIEDRDNEGMLEVDFANSYVGGGVLSSGCVQEEIRFVICPELIISRLFTERLQDNEVLIIQGFERYSDYTGYASTFKFAGDYKQTNLKSKHDRFPSTLVVMDALKFHFAPHQFRKENIDRELNKAYVGFYRDPEENPSISVATGNWGCGAFGGDPQLKSLLQLMAASENDRDVLYFTFGDEELRDEIYGMYQLLCNANITVGKLYEILVCYARDVNVIDQKSNQTLFEYIEQSLVFHDDTDDEDNQVKLKSNEVEVKKQTMMTDFFMAKP